MSNYTNNTNNTNNVNNVNNTNNTNNNGNNKQYNNIPFEEITDPTIIVEMNKKISGLCILPTGAFGDNIAEMFKDLAKAQKDMPNIVKNKKADKSKYATLDNILEIIKPKLAENNFALVQNSYSDGTYIGVQTILYHSTGGEIRSSALLYEYTKVLAGKYENILQNIGGMLTYFRRYSVCGVMGIVLDDDDANSLPTRYNNNYNNNYSNNNYSSNTNKQNTNKQNTNNVNKQNNPNTTTTNPNVNTNTTNTNNPNTTTNTAANKIATKEHETKILELCKSINITWDFLCEQYKLKPGTNITSLSEQNANAIISKLSEKIEKAKAKEKELANTTN